jgi:hypothetical protein
MFTVAQADLMVLLSALFTLVAYPSLSRS